MHPLTSFKAIGEDVRIDQNVCIKHPELVSLGSHISIDWGFYCTTQMEVKDYVHIAPYCTVIGGEQGVFKMGNFAGMAAGCRIICVSDDYTGESLIVPWLPAKYRKLTAGPVVLEDYATLGTNAVIFPGITIAEGSVVGAGSLITKDTKPWGIYAGVPARFLRTRSQKLLEYAKELGYGSKESTNHQV